jgi:hypothetical protein
MTGGLPQAEAATMANESAKIAFPLNGGPQIEPEGRSASALRQSLLRYSPAMMLVIIAVADAGRFADPDLWGHIVFGRGILSSGHLTRIDPYSYSAAGHVWNDHEWLSEVALAAFYGAMGVVGLKLMKFICTAATIVLIALGQAETGATVNTQFVVLIVTAMALGPQMQFRPQLFTFIFLAAMLWLLARDNYGRRAHLWLIIPMMALWVNFHGGFFIGLVVLGLYTVVATTRDLIEGRGWRHGIGLAAITVAAAAATLVTPYGLDNWRAVSHTLNNSMTRELVMEWEPLLVVMRISTHSARSVWLLYLAILGLMGALVVAFALTPRGGDLPMVTIAALMIVAAFTSVRNMALAVIAVSGPLTRHAMLVAARWRGNAPAPPAIPRQSRGNQIVMALIAVAVLVETGLFSPRLTEGIRYPTGAVAFMHARGLKGNILCDFNWGEYLIFHSAPDSKVFMDSRYDLVYPSKVIRDYVDFYFGLTGANRVINSYPHDFVLIPPHSGAWPVMIARKDWRLIYRDQDAGLFARVDSPIARSAGVPVVGKAATAYFP